MKREERKRISQDIKDSKDRLKNVKNDIKGNPKIVRVLEELESRIENIENHLNFDIEV